MKTWREYDLPNGKLYLLQQVVIESGLDGFGKLRVRIYGGVYDLRPFLPTQSANDPAKTGTVMFLRRAGTLLEAKWRVFLGAKNDCYI